MNQKVKSYLNEEYNSIKYGTIGTGLSMLSIGLGLRVFIKQPKIEVVA